MVDKDLPPKAALGDWLEKKDGVVKESSRIRLDIQVLRAIAVMMVLLTHLWPSRLPGGYAGVDVFFVISGFLITTHLLKEMKTTGRINLLQFYARRLRRLLPAAILVLLVSMFAMFFLVSSESWTRNLSEMLAASFYGENLYLTSLAIDYHAQNTGETLVQHYWSLSLEEQFYLLWPGILLLISTMVKGSKTAQNHQHRRKITLLVISIIVVLSFAFNCWFTSFSQNQAYFFTPTRFWELGIGALLATAADNLALLRLSTGCYYLLAGLGWSGIGFSNYWLTASTPFPGTAALIPVCSTAILIGLGITEKAADQGLTRYLYSWRWLQYLGDISYALYLWHWPLLLLTKAILGRDIFYYEKIMVALVTLLCASVSKKYVEDPARQALFFSRSLKRTFLPTLCVMGLVTLGWLGGNYWAKQVENWQSGKLKGILGQKCAGPKAMVESDCHNQHAPITIDNTSKEAIYYGHGPHCLVEQPAVGPRPAVVLCDYSKQIKDKVAGEQEKVIVLGDSHAEQWNHALEWIAKQRGWKIYFMLKAGCPLVKPAYISEQMEAGRPANDRCRDSAEEILDYVQKTKFDRIIFSAHIRKMEIANPAGQPDPDKVMLWKKALTEVWQEWMKTGKTVTVIADTPENDTVRDLNCIPSILNNR